MNVQFGCGLCAPASWVNFDCSPTLRLQRLPLIGGIMPTGPYGRFPPNVRFGDIVRGLPLPTGSVRALYASHVLEHLSLDDLRIALRNSKDVLSPDGIFRLVVPDLEFLANRYATDRSPTAALNFMQDSGLGRVSRPRTVSGLIRSWLGNAQHLWMWDFKGLAAELKAAGFTDVRQAAFGDSREPAFGVVEDLTRWANALGIECS
jgi:SAM-dependent methyltransferase